MRQKSKVSVSLKKYEIYLFVYLLFYLKKNSDFHIWNNGTHMNLMKWIIFLNKIYRHNFHYFFPIKVFFAINKVLFHEHKYPLQILIYGFSLVYDRNLRKHCRRSRYDTIHIFIFTQFQPYSFMGFLLVSVYLINPVIFQDILRPKDLAWNCCNILLYHKE